MKTICKKRVTKLVFLFSIIFMACFSIILAAYYEGEKQEIIFMIIATLLSIVFLLFSGRLLKSILR